MGWYKSASKHFTAWCVESSESSFFTKFY